MPERPRSLASVLALLLAGASTALLAQEWAGRARVQGIVTDEEGRPIAGAKVTLAKDGVEGNGPEPVSTNDKGRWSRIGLDGGDWKAVIEAAGFRPSEGTIHVTEFGVNPAIEVELRRFTREELEQAASEGSLGKLDEGNKLLSEGRPAEARAAYEEALADLEDPANHPPILRGIARTYYQEGNAEMAIASLEKALAIAPDDPESLQLIISLLVAANREADAQAYMARLPEGVKMDPDALLNLGIKAYNEGNFAGAVDYFERAVAENPGLADAYYYRGLSHLQLEHNAAALADFKKMLEIAPDHPRAGEAQEFVKYLESQATEQP